MSLVERIAALAGRDRIAATGIALGGVWLLLVALFWMLAPESEAAPGGVARLAVIAATLLPLGLIWLAVATARALAVLRAEADDLRQRMSLLRDAASPRGAPPAPDREGPETVGSRAPAPSPRPAPPSSGTRQPPARPDGPAADPVDAETLVRALDFPDGPDDSLAIAALRRALGDAGHARVLRAAQDVVTLLAGRDLYMDDLPPDPAPPGLWRRFAEGARGGDVAAIGGIHDAAALETTAALLQDDEIFRDTAHHFLRHFDTMLTRQLPEMDDAQIAVLTQTRSARAFMLLGRIAGIFG